MQSKTKLICIFVFTFAAVLIIGFFFYKKEQPIRSGNVAPPSNLMELLATYGKPIPQPGNPDTLIRAYTEAIKSNPEDPRGYSARARLYLEKGDVEKALNDFDQAIRLNPKDGFSFFARGYISYAKGDFEKTINDLSEAFRFIPAAEREGTRIGLTIHTTRGLAYMQRGELESAINDFTDAIRFNSNNFAAYYSRGNAYSDKNELEKAIADYTEAIRLEPKNPELYGNRGLAFSKKNDLDKAISDYSAAIQFDPTNVWTYIHRSEVYHQKGDCAKAASDLYQAIQINPEDCLAHNDLAWLLATCSTPSLRDGTKAIELAKKACELTEWKEWSFIGTLAAACAETGDFEQAIKYQKRTLTSDDLTDNDRAEEQRRLELFQQRKAYHEPSK